MLATLKGTVTAVLGNRIIIEVQNIGYFVQTGSWQPELNAEILCYLHHHIKEDASDLYGFASMGELNLFEKMITISGIGPKAALALLSLGTANQIIEAIEQKNIAFLTAAPGIGQKAAQKIILELHSKLDSLHDIIEGSSGDSELYQALESLGYSHKDIRVVASKIPANLTSIEDQLKWCLQNIS